MTKKKIALITNFIVLLLAIAVLLTGCNDNNETPTPQLALSASRINVEMGQTASVKILSGSGSYSIQSSASVVQARLDNEEITLTGIKQGQDKLFVTDTRTSETDTVAVTVTPHPATLTYSDLEKWFEGELPADAENARIKNDETVDNTATSSYYKIKIDQDTASLKITTLSSNSWEAKATVDDTLRNADFFKNAVKAYMADGNYEFYVAQVWDEEATGSNRTQIDNKADLQTALDDTDFTKLSMRAGFKKGDNVVQVSIQSRRSEIQIHTAVWGDHWLYYARHLLGTNFEKTYIDNYMWVKSYGFIPGYAQLMIINGRDSQQTPFELDVYGELSATATVNKLEGYYNTLKNNHEAALAYWEKMMKQTNLGTFEQAVVIFNGSQQQVTLKTIDQAITYARNNSTADYKAIMPIFRSEGDYVVIPQFDKNGLVMVMSILKSTDVNAVKALAATGKAL